MNHRGSEFRLFLFFICVYCLNYPIRCKKLCNAKGFPKNPKTGGNSNSISPSSKFANYLFLQIKPTNPLTQLINSPARIPSPLAFDGPAAFLASLELDK